MQFLVGLKVDDLKSSVFKEIWDSPVCELFTPSTDDDFIGECDLETPKANAECSSGGFCDGLDKSKKSLVESVIASQIARTILGFTHGATGMSAQHSAINQVSNPSHAVIVMLSCAQAPLIPHSPHIVCWQAPVPILSHALIAIVQMSHAQHMCRLLRRQYQKLRP